jgi:hypothetical protein
MDGTELLEQIGQKGSDKEALAARVIKEPKLLKTVIEGLDARPAAVKYGCSKILRLISQQKPALLYPSFDLFVRRLDLDNTFLKCDAVLTIANLTAVDTEHKFEAVFERYFAPIEGPTLIVAANIIGSAAVIAQARPELSDRIATELLKVENARYQTDECRRIALGQAVESLGKFFESIGDKERVKRFARKQLENTRAGSRQKALAFFREHGD